MGKNKLGTCAVIIGLNADLYGNIIGSRLPQTLSYSKLCDLYNKYKVTGDKKLVYRTDIMKETDPYPVFDGEKLVPLDYKYNLIDQKYEMIVTNEIFCHVEYQPDGSTNSVYRQYFESPRGFAAARKVSMRYSPSFRNRFRSAIHYVSSSIISKNKIFLKESPQKVLTIIAIPLGLLLTACLKYKVDIKKHSSLKRRS